MDKEKFQEDLKASLPLISQEPSVDAKTHKYHIILNSIMDKLAPLKKKRIKKDMKQPCYDEQLSNEIQLRYLKERKWKLSGNEYDYITLQYQKRHVTKIIHAKRKQYYNDLFSNINQDTKMLYTEANKLLFQKEELPLSHEEDPKILAERFNKFFTLKIEKIMAALVPTDTHPIDESSIETKPQTDHKFSEFNTLSDKMLDE